MGKGGSYIIYILDLRIVGLGHFLWFTDLAYRNSDLELWRVGQLL